MSISIAPNPLPTGYGPEDLDGHILAEIGCRARWKVAYDVTTCVSDGTWKGFVHEFELLGHPKAKSCYVIRNRGSNPSVEVLLKDDGVYDPEAAVKWMFLNLREDRVSTS